MAEEFQILRPREYHFQLVAKGRRADGTTPNHIEPPSPLKCLKNLADPSPTKGLPTILKNPFNLPVKRRLMLSPRKSMKSPVKRNRMLGLDEDANLEPPRMKRTTDYINGISGSCSGSANSPSKIMNCTRNDWTLKTKLKVRFVDYCKNWNESSTSTHKRLSNGQIQDSPSKLNDKSISIEAIKNVGTVYQHPYMAWLPLFPRGASETDYKQDTPAISFTKNAEIAHLMLKDWCTSLDDLTNLIIDGKCPYFYMCAENFNVLFKQTPSSVPKKPIVQVYVSPFSYGMACELDKWNCEYRYPGEAPRRATLQFDAKENSRTSFGSSQSLHLVNLDESSSQDSKQLPNIRKIPSIDSGHCSDLSDDEDDANAVGDTSQILDSIGLSQQDFPTLQSKPKGFVEKTDSNTQSKSTSNRPLAIIEGAANMRKFIKFLQSNRTYTLTNLGKFASIPPTLLSPREFRLSTPRVPDVILSKNIMERHKSPSKVGLKSKTIPSKSPTKTNTAIGPTFIEIKGTVLPDFYSRLNDILIDGENKDHTCQATVLESSRPFQSVG